MKAKLLKKAALNFDPWIGVDLDGSLAQSLKDYSDPTLIGEPIPAMVEKVRAAIASGYTVKVFTARMADEDHIDAIREAIASWTEKHIGTALEATNEKDPGMVYLVDDKARQVIEDTGKVITAKIAREDYNEDGYWANNNGASGVLPIAQDSKRICLAWRSSDVHMGDCWGTLGGAIKEEHSPAESAEAEMAEEVGYHGSMSMHPAYVFQDGKFKYFNFIGVVPSEFPFSPASGHSWETDHIEWFTYDEIVKGMEESPGEYHPGLIKLFKNSRGVIQKLTKGGDSKEVSEAPLDVTYKILRQRNGNGYIIDASLDDPIDPLPLGKLKLSEGSTPSKVRMVFVEDVIVDPGFRRRGIGYSLYRKAITLAQRKGFERFQQGTPRTEDADKIWMKLAQEFTVQKDENGSDFIDLTNPTKTANSRADSVTPSILGKAVKRFCRSDAAFNLLDETTANGGTWTSGGCWILADAIHSGFGGELYTILGKPGTDPEGDRRPQHMMVKFGGTFVDADGASSSRALLRRWTETEGVLDATLEPLDASTVRPGIPAPPQKRAEIIDGIRSFLLGEASKTASPDFGYTQYNDRESDIEKLKWSESQNPRTFSIHALDRSKWTEAGAEEVARFAIGRFDPKTNSSIPGPRNGPAHPDAGSVDTWTAFSIIQARINPEWYGTGLGQMAYDKLIAKARELGADALYSDKERSPEAEKAWKRLGRRYPVTFVPELNRFRLDLAQNGKTAATSREGLHLPNTMYHVSRKKNRAGITKGGLSPQIKEFPNLQRKPAIYLLETLQQAEDWAYWFGGGEKTAVDIRQVQIPDDLTLTQDTTDMDEVYDSWITYDPIPVSSLKIIKTMGPRYPKDPPSTGGMKVQRITAAASTAITYRNECTGYSGHETFCRIVAQEAEGNQVGLISYGIYQDEIHIKMIEVDPQFRRQGIATQLMAKLRSENPGLPIHWGMLTDDGSALKEKIHQPSDEPPNRLFTELEASREDFARDAQIDYDSWPSQITEWEENGPLDGGLAAQIANSVEFLVHKGTNGTAITKKEGDNLVIDCEYRGRAAKVCLPTDIFQERVGDKWRKKEGVVIKPEDFIITEFPSTSGPTQSNKSSSLKGKTTRLKTAAASPELGYLRDYMKMDDRDKATEMAYSFSGSFASFLREEHPDIAEKVLDDDEDFLEDISEVPTPVLKEFMDSSYVHEIMQNEPHYAPLFMHSDYQGDVNNEWLVHFTDHATQVAKEGFTRGVEDFRQLGLTTHFKEESKTGGGYNFAFEVHNINRHAFRRSHNSNSHYGRECVIFKASGVKVFHYGDEEPQVIFWGKDARYIIPVYRNYDNWALPDGPEGEPLQEDENLEVLCAWVEQNYAKYKKFLTPSMPKKGRRTAADNNVNAYGLDPEAQQIVDRYEAQGVAITLSGRGDYMKLDAIQVPKENRNQGIGSRFMEELAAYADRAGKTVFLTPSKDFGATSVARLRKFYSRFGFKPNKGRNKDFRSWDAMVRQPKRPKKADLTPSTNWYHGSTSFSGPKIIQDGYIRPGMPTDYLAGWDPREDCVYITCDLVFAQQYAGEEGFIFRVEVPTPADLIVDEDIIDAALVHNNVRGSRDLAEQVRRAYCLQHGEDPEWFHRAFDGKYKPFTEQNRNMLFSLADYIRKHNPALHVALLEKGTKAAHIGPLKVAELVQSPAKVLGPGGKRAGSDKNPPGKPETEYPEDSNGWALFPDQRPGQNEGVDIGKMIPEI